MSDLKVTGKLIEKYDTQQVSDKFQKREFVLELVENNYTNYAKFQLVQANCAKLDTHNVGDTVEVSFNVKGNRWEKDGKTLYITNLDAWKVWGVSNGQNVPTQANADNYYNPAPDVADDLPF